MVIFPNLRLRRLNLGQFALALNPDLVNAYRKPISFGSLQLSMSAILG